MNAARRWLNGLPIELRAQLVMWSALLGSLVFTETWPVWTVIPLAVSWFGVGLLAAVYGV